MRPAYSLDKFLDSTVVKDRNAVADERRHEPGLRMKGRSDRGTVAGPHPIEQNVYDLAHLGFIRRRHCCRWLRDGAGRA
jgi:hypothetical protein